MPSRICLVGLHAVACMAQVPVDGMALFASTSQVVLLPVALGTLLNRMFPASVAKIAPFTPALAVAMVATICACVMAQTSSAVRQAGAGILLAVAALHVGGFALGYLASRAFGIEEKAARTNSIEVGMQNSTLGASLALLHFADPVTAVPCVMSACVHSVLGSALAGFWRTRDERAARHAAAV